MLTLEYPTSKTEQNLPQIELLNQQLKLSQEIAALSVIHTSPNSLNIGNNLCVNHRNNNFVVVTENSTFKYFTYLIENKTQRYLSIDFCPTTPTQEKASDRVRFGEKAFVIKEGGLAFLKLLELLETQFLDVDYLIGTTNPEMAEFARKIGFKSVPNFPARIFISREDVLKVKKLLLAYIQRANKILEKKN